LFAPQRRDYAFYIDFLLHALEKYPEGERSDIMDAITLGEQIKAEAKAEAERKKVEAEKEAERKKVRAEKDSKDWDWTAKSIRNSTGNSTGTQT
jgi:regulator of protease activity HflC (stomatin/prohibitin superfamily)